jgi:hypothetical protein
VALSDDAAALVQVPRALRPCTAMAACCHSAELRPPRLRPPSGRVMHGAWCAVTARWLRAVGGGDGCGACDQHGGGPRGPRDARHVQERHRVRVRSAPPANICAGTGLTADTSAPGLAHTCHICAGTWLAPPMSAPGLCSPNRSHICAGTRLVPTRNGNNSGVVGTRTSRAKLTWTSGIQPYNMQDATCTTATCHVSPLSNMAPWLPRSSAGLQIPRPEGHDQLHHVARDRLRHIGSTAASPCASLSGNGSRAAQA